MIHIKKLITTCNSSSIIGISIKHNKKIMTRSFIGYISFRTLPYLPRGLRFQGSFKVLNRESYFELPDNLTVSNLDLNGSSGITRLPNNLTITRDYLDICGTNITELPSDLSFNGDNFFASNKEIKNSYKRTRLRSSS